MTLFRNSIFAILYATILATAIISAANSRDDHKEFVLGCGAARIDEIPNNHIDPPVGKVSIRVNESTGIWIAEDGNPESQWGTMLNDKHGSKYITEFKSVGEEIVNYSFGLENNTWFAIRFQSSSSGDITTIYICPDIS